MTGCKAGRLHAVEPATRDHLEKLGVALDTFCAKLAERERLAACGRALEVIEQGSSGLVAPAMAIGGLICAHERLRGLFGALHERHVLARRELGCVERELCTLAKENLDLPSVVRLSAVLESLRAERETIAAESAAVAERERNLKAEAESLRRAHARLALLRAKAGSVQTAPSRVERNVAGVALALARLENGREKTVFDRACVALEARRKAYDETLKSQAAALWAQRERLVQGERLRRSLPGPWRPSAAPAEGEFERIISSVARARASAETTLRKKDELAAHVTELERELAETEASYRFTVGEVAVARRDELDRMLAAMAEPLRACELAPAPVRPDDEFEGVVHWCEALLPWCDRTRAAAAKLRAEVSAEKKALEATLEALLRAHGVDGVTALAARYLGESAEAERRRV